MGKWRKLGASNFASKDLISLAESISGVLDTSSKSLKVVAAGARVANTFIRQKRSAFDTATKPIKKKVSDYLFDVVNAKVGYIVIRPSLETMKSQYKSTFGYQTFENDLITSFRDETDLERPTLNLGGTYVIVLVGAPSPEALLERASALFTLFNMDQEVRAFEQLQRDVNFILKRPRYQNPAPVGLRSLTRFRWNTLSTRKISPTLIGGLEKVLVGASSALAQVGVGTDYVSNMLDILDFKISRFASLVEEITAIINAIKAVLAISGQIHYLAGTGRSLAEVEASIRSADTKPDFQEGTSLVFGICFAGDTPNMSKFTTALGL